MALLEEEEIDTLLSQNWLKFKRENDRGGGKCKF